VKSICSRWRKPSSFMNRTNQRLRHVTKEPCRAPAKPLRAARHKTRQSNAPAFDARGALYAILGVDLTQIHGLGPYLALKLISECDTDLSAWPSAKHFTSWLSLAPVTKSQEVRSCRPAVRKSCRRAVEACHDDGRSDRDDIGSFLSPPLGADRTGKSSHSDSSKDRSQPGGLRRRSPHPEAIFLKRSPNNWRFSSVSANSNCTKHSPARFAGGLLPRNLCNKNRSIACDEACRDTGDHDLSLFTAPSTTAPKLRVSSGASPRPARACPTVRCALHSRSPRRPVGHSTSPSRSLARSGRGDF
jgi:hypothetical protein